MRVALAFLIGGIFGVECANYFHPDHNEPDLDAVAALHECQHKKPVVLIPGLYSPVPNPGICITVRVDDEKLQYKEELIVSLANDLTLQEKKIETLNKELAECTDDFHTDGVAFQKMLREAEYGLKDCRQDNAGLRSQLNLVEKKQ